MAGLFDFFQPQGGSGLFGNVGGWLGNNQDALVAMGLGMAGGNTAMEGFKGGMQGYLSGRASDQSRVAGEGFLKDLGLGVAPSAGPFSKPTPAMPQMAPQGGQPNFGNAIAGIESGGKYDALGPVVPKTGDRAYGKYQVMGANIPQWTQAHLGQSMTPEQFLANPQAQDAVFKGQFGQYAQQYGPEGAARAWFAGPGNMNNLGAKDQLGTTVGGYGQKFAQAAGIGPQVMGPTGPARPDAQGVYGPDAVMMPQQPGATPAPVSPAAPAQAVPQDALGRIRQMPIETVMRWAMNPNLKGPQAEVAKEIFKARLEDTKMTEAQKDYMRAKVDGYQGSFADWKNQPSFGETGRRDEYDRPIQGWRNPNTGQVSAPTGGVAGNTAAPIAQVTELRKEVQALPSYKNITQAAPVYKSMLDAAGRDNRAADVNMIYGLAKIMDPTSVVRESEMTIAQAVATLPQQLQATVTSQLTSSGRLSPEVRAAIMQEAHSRVSAYKGMFDQDAGQYRGIAQRHRMNLADVLPDFGEFPEFVNQKTMAPPGTSMPAPPATPLVAPPKTGDWQDMPGGVRIRQKQ
jgi:hypothetical protein